MRNPLRWLRAFICRKLCPPKKAKKGTFDPHLAFRSAEAFEQCVQVLDRDRLSGNVRILPLALVTIAAFALETYLKCLLALEQNVYPEGHDAEELFRNLNRRTKDSLRKFHREYLKDNPGIEAVAKKHGFKTDLDSLLHLGKNAFVEFRYAYEKLPVDSAWSLGSLIFGVRERILKLHPEWETQ